MSLRKLALGLFAAVLALAASPAWADPATSSVFSPTNVPTITAGAYGSTGLVLGGIQTVNVAPSGALANAEVVFDSGTFAGTEIDEIVFNASPTGGGTTDHAALAITATDTPKVIGVLQLSQCTSLGGVFVQCQTPSQTQFATAGGTKVYIVAVIRGTVTFAGAGDAHFGWQWVK